MCRAWGPIEMKPVGEIEFVNGREAISRRGDRRRRLQMMLGEPDLIDADTLRQLDFFELPLWQERQLRPVIRRPKR